MQESFLEYVLTDLQKRGHSLQKCTFILPSKRSGTFLKKAISASVGKNIFSPPVWSIEDFVVQLSGLTPVSNIELLFLLYEAYTETETEHHDDFNTFLKWGQTLLQDFNEIDRYLIPANEILNYLSSIKEINHWSLKKDKTEMVTNYLELWNNLESLYQHFTTKLLQQQMGYQGLIYRTAAKHIEGHNTNTPGPKVFVGFNALNTAETSIIQHYLQQPDTLIYWDMDTYFYQDPVHDAGLFLRTYKKDWPYFQHQNPLGLHQTFLTPKDISITGVPKSISQAKYVGNLLHDIQKQTPEALKNAAVVLADESLLNPILHAIPESIAEVNITMGQPLNKTVLYAFFLSFLDLHLAKTNRGWFFDDLLQFFSSPFCQSISASEPEDSVKVIQLDIQEHNRLYLSAEHLHAQVGQSRFIQNTFPKDVITPQQWLDSCLAITQTLKDIFQDDQKKMELEHLYGFHTLFNQLKNQISAVDFITDLKSLKTFFQQLSAMETLDFIGEPLSGLQIMGMLESRNLDFETVIITSVNEGIIPSGKSNNSFFPYDVKRDYGLPTFKEKDAIYTYHFYRLIQRAKHVYLIYNTEPDVLEGGEKSRLISQLLTDRNIASYVTHTIAAPELLVTPHRSTQIPKSEQLIHDIKAYASRGFSPTSLTNYIRNPIDFYKRNILKVDEVNEVEETIAANTFGTIVHDSLETLYRPLIGKILTEKDLSMLQSQIPQIVASEFERQLPGVNISKGRYLLIFNVTIKYLQRFVLLELEQLKKHQIKILALEEKYEIDLDIPGLNFPIKLKGALDRVDEVDGILRIVDYKTGRVEPGHVKIKDWDELRTNYDKSKAFQLLCYGYLYSKTHTSQQLKAGLYSLKNLGRGFLEFTDGSNFITPDTLQLFKEQLHHLIQEICNPSIPFLEKEV